MHAQLYCGALLIGLLQTALFTTVATCAEPPHRGSAEEGRAAALVRRGLDAEILGDAEQRRGCLADALTVMTDYHPARWHSGYVRISDSWLTLDEHERRNAVDSRTTQYRHLRDQMAGSLAGEIKLARWCREQKFDELEKFHWSNVLQIDSSHGEARGRLGVREINGMLLTAEQIEQYRQARDAYERAMNFWKPRLTKWRAAIEGPPSPERDTALAQLREIRDVAAIPAIVQTLSSAGTEVSIVVIDVLSQMDDPQATEALLRYALIPDDETVRRAATESLKSKSWFAVIPSLLGSMEMPAKLSYYVASYDYTVGYSLQLIRDGRTEVNTLERTFSTDYSGKAIKPTTRKQADKYRRQLANLADNVDQANERLMQWNLRVCTLLRAITDQKLDDKPDSWWKWWEKWNELDDSVEKTELYTKQSVAVRHIARPTAYVLPINVAGAGRSDTPSPTPTRRLPRINAPIWRTGFPSATIPRYSCCLLPGTQVWTSTGSMAIEKVRAGDRVLAQDPESGELAYKLVLETVNRPSSASLRVGVKGEEISTTLGHPMWVVGKGWLMAKELKVGHRLHGASGGVPIEYIEKGPDSEAFNLVVADFSTYFVGKHRVLVHDNLARSPTEVPLPGYPAE